MSTHQSERRTTYDPERELVSDNSTDYACLGDSTNWINMSWDQVGQDIYGEFSYDYCGTSVMIRGRSRSSVFVPNYRHLAEVAFCDGG